MTMDEIRRSNQVFLTADEVAPVIGCNPQAIRVQAHADPLKLGFPVVVIGRRVRIPRAGFIEALGGIE